MVVLPADAAGSCQGVRLGRRHTTEVKMYHVHSGISCRSTALKVGCLQKTALGYDPDQNFSAVTDRAAIIGRRMGAGTQPLLCAFYHLIAIHSAQSRMPAGESIGVQDGLRSSGPFSIIISYGIIL